jgi:hypothetical protein
MSLQMNWEKQASLGLGEGRMNTRYSQVICKLCGEFARNHGLVLIIVFDFLN